MTRKYSKQLPSIRQQIVAMLEFHACAFHLPHVKRYHGARQKSSISYDRQRPQFGVLQKVCELPLYVLGVGWQPRLELVGTARSGRLQFLNWNRLLRVIAEVREDSTLVSVATGGAVRKQCSIVERILRRKRQLTRLAILSVPILHFRALIYEQKKDGTRKLVPLISPVERLRLGTVYRPEYLANRLQSAVARRMKAPGQIPRS